MLECAPDLRPRATLPSMRPKTKALAALLLAGCAPGLAPARAHDLDAAFRAPSDAEVRCRAELRRADVDVDETVRNGLAEDALRKASASLTLCERELSPDHLDTARVRIVVARLSAETGDARTARAQAERALAVFVPAEGEAHGDSVRALEVMEMAASAAKDYAQARSLGLRIVAIREQSANAPRLVRALERLAFACQKLGQPSEAIAALTRALEKVSWAEPEHSEPVARVRAQLGVMYRDTGDLARAEPLLATALADLARGSGEVEEVAVVASLLAALHHWGTRDFVRAEPLYRRALAIRVARLPRGHVKTAETQVNLGVLLCERGACSEGRPMFDEGALVLERQAGRDAPELARARNRMRSLGAAR